MPIWRLRSGEIAGIAGVRSGAGRNRGQSGPVVPAVTRNVLASHPGGSLELPGASCSFGELSPGSASQWSRPKRVLSLGVLEYQERDAGDSHAEEWVA